MSAAGGLLARWPRSLSERVDQATATPWLLRQTAAVRIGAAGTWLAYLLREWPHRGANWGPDAPWSMDLSGRLMADAGAFSVLTWSESPVWFEICYAAFVLSAVLMMLGWRTRGTSVLFMIGVGSLWQRSLMGDSGDLVVQLLAYYLVLTRCGQVWSLDARRRARASGVAATDRTAVVGWLVSGVALGWGTVVSQDAYATHPLVPGLAWAVWLALAARAAVGRAERGGQARVFLNALTNLVHNVGVVVIFAQVLVIYTSAGWAKTQGATWTQGFAVHYSMKLEDFRPWPYLSDLVASNTLLVFVLTAGTVALQIATPLVLYGGRTRNVILFLLAGEHIGIAILLGIPFFSAAMLAADAILLPTAALVRLERLWARHPEPDGAQRAAASCSRRAEVAVAGYGIARRDSQEGPKARP